MATGWPMKTTYADGDVYAAQDVNDITGTINLLGSSVAYAAGKNKIINGDFFVNQRNFTSTTTDAFTYDRWSFITTTGGTASAQTFTPGTAPVAGYEGKNYFRVVTTGQTGTGVYTIFGNPIEDVRTLAGQTATLSFWAKSATGTPKIAVEYYLSYGSGGSSAVANYVGQVTLSTSWTRYTLTSAVPSVSGKTIGAGSNIKPQFWVSAGTDFNSRTGSLGIQSNTFEVWGVQLEAGSTATAFQTATGTIQGELALCQRYYVRYDGTDDVISNGAIYSTTKAYSVLQYPVEMRVAPTLSASTAGAVVIFANGGSATSTANAFAEVGTKTARWEITSSGLTSGYACWLQFVSSGKFLEISAEL
jgi:hypothetical protein